jgi:hypothetical protein
VTVASPAWLPRRLNLSGDPTADLPLLYSVFERDFKDVDTDFGDREVRWKHRILPGSLYEEGFWHLVSTEAPDGISRIYEPARASKLPWFRPTLQHSAEPEVVVWNYMERGTRLRTYVWLQALDYCIVLEPRDQGTEQFVFIITAYHVDGASRRRNLRHKLAERTT